MPAIEGFQECFSHSANTTNPLLECCFGLYSSLDDGTVTAETLPDDEEIIEENGNTIRVTKGSFFSVERGSVSQLHLGIIASLNGRLFNGGSRMMVQRRSLRVIYRVRSSVIDQYLRLVLSHVLDSMSEERNSHRKSMVFHATFGHAISMPNEPSIFIVSIIASTRFRTHPATREAVGRLQKTKIGEGSKTDNRDCAICIEELSPDMEHMRMPCEHVYHEDCIITWLKSNHVCPLCRFSLMHD